MIALENSLGLPRPLLVAMAAAAAAAVDAVVVSGRLGDTDRTRSARTASLNVVVGVVESEAHATKGFLD